MQRFTPRQAEVAWVEDSLLGLRATVYQKVVPTLWPTPPSSSSVLVRGDPVGWGQGSQKAIMRGRCAFKEHRVEFGPIP